MFPAHPYKVLGVKGTQLISLVRAGRVARYEIPSREGPQCCLDNNLRERASDVESGAHVTWMIKLS